MAEEHRQTCKVSQETLLCLSNVPPANATVADLASSCPFCNHSVAFHDREANVSSFDASMLFNYVASSLSDDMYLLP